KSNSVRVSSGKSVRMNTIEISAGSVETVEGNPVTISVADGMVMVNDATVVETDIMGSNGVIHVIDKVIMPSAM
ncbi:MAG: fasciclin domain-containing protein, partial [Limnospira sp.]